MGRMEPFFTRPGARLVARTFLFWAKKFAECIVGNCAWWTRRTRLFGRDFEVALEFVMQLHYIDYQ